MRPNQFRKYLDRDGGCVHCGELEAVAPHHRENRGMGGSKKLDAPSNIIVLCSVLNWLLESDAEWAETARQYGWKLPRGSVATEVPVYYPARGGWFLLDDMFHVKHCEASGEIGKAG